MNPGSENSEASKFFNKKEYSTLIVKPEKEETGSTVSRKEINRMISLLTNPVHREMKHDILTLIKEKNALDILIDAMLENKDPGKRHFLVAACWESGLDCSEHLLFFTGLAIQDEYLAALEAITVIETMDLSGKKEDVGKALKKIDSALDSSPGEKKILLNELKGILENTNQEFN